MLSGAPMPQPEKQIHHSRGLDPWTCAATLPGILTVVIIAYGGLAWMGNQPGHAQIMSQRVPQASSAPLTVLAPPRPTVTTLANTLPTDQKSEAERLPLNEQPVTFSYAAATE